MKQGCIAELRGQLTVRSISARELVSEYLNKIKEADREYNCFITVDGEAAVERADRIDRLISAGESVAPLFGIPFAVKDNLCTRCVRTTCGSRMLEDFVPPYTATSVERLLSVGGIMIGKTNMDEFGMGSASDTSAFGAVHNPHDLTRSAGGSSGGSAAAVASGLVPYALGSDTGGSVRLPAAYCGCVGLKPTYGAVSRYGLVAFASSLDTVGVLCTCVDDTRTVFEAMRGRDMHDATSREYGVHKRERTPLKVGVCMPMLSCVDSAVADSVCRAIKIFEDKGAQIVPVDLPDKDLAVAAYYVISSAEASSNLARYDGIRYGHRAEGAESLEELFVRSRTEGFGDEVKRRIMLGTFCLHGGGRMEYYMRAMSARAKLSSELDSILRECDVILLPTAPSTAPLLHGRRGLDMWRDDAFCLYASLAGLPALNVPLGESGGMPIGVQLVGRSFDEETLFAAGELLEVSDE